MTPHQLHEFLTSSLGLVPEPVANLVSRTYFYQRVEWHPRHSTRVFRVIYDAKGEVGRIQLCASSDNNNTALVSPPFDETNLAQLAHAEIGKVEDRLKARASESI